MGNAANDGNLPDDPQEESSADSNSSDSSSGRPARPSFRDRMGAAKSPSDDGASGSDAKSSRPSRLTPPPVGDSAKSASDGEAKPARRSFGDRLNAGATERPARPTASTPPPPVGESQSSAQASGSAEAATERPARRSFGERLAADPPAPRAPRTPAAPPVGASSSESEVEAETEATAAETPVSATPETPKTERAPRTPAPKPTAPERPARPARSFGDALGNAEPRAPRQVSALDQERLNRLQSLQSQGGAVSTSFQNMVQGMRNKSAAASRATTSRTPAPEVNIENRPDYVDILSHLDARTKVHSEYQEVLEQYGPRLFTGGEVLAGALLGLNASLMDTVHRRLTNTNKFPLYIDFKEIALTPILVVTEGGQQHEIELSLETSKPTIVGRGSDCTKQVQAQFVSRHHISITNKMPEGEPPMWVIEDLQSTHGTTINETQLIGKETLKPGDIVKLGANYGAPDHPRLEILYRAKNYSREALDQLLARVDIVVAVAQADHAFEGQKVFINNLNSNQSNGALVVIAVSRTKPIDDEDVEVNVDDLRQAANVRLGRKTRRHLTPVYEKSMGESDWTDDIFEFIDSFKELALDDVVQQRRKNTRKEVVTAITKVGSRIRPSIEAALAEAQRKRVRVEDEMTGAPRALQSGDALREDSFKELKQTIEDAAKDYGNDIKPESLTYFAQSMIESAPYTTRKGAKLLIDLVVPGTNQPGQQPQPPHHWLLHHMREHARIYFAKLRGDVVGRNASPPGVGYVLNELRTGLAANDKVRDQNLFDADRYERYEVPELARRIEQKIASDFVHGESATTEKIDNMFTYLVTKTRYAFMFYLSIFTIIGIFGGISFRSVFKDWIGKQPIFIVAPAGALILGLLAFSNYKAFKAATKDKVEEEVLKLKEKAKKHYSEAAKTVIDDCKRELLKHIAEQETDVKRVMGTLGNSRMSESMMQRNNPALDAARADCDYVESQIVMIDQEKEWAKLAEKDYTESPFYEDPNARARPRLGSRLR